MPNGTIGKSPAVRRNPVLNCNSEHIPCSLLQGIFKNALVLLGCFPDISCNVRR